MVVCWNLTIEQVLDVNEEINENLINLEFTVDEGEKFYVDRINILGNTVTAESVIRNQLLLDEQEKITLEADSGSVMSLAVENGVAGIDGDCGGVCSCATCHVHVKPEHVSKTGEASEIEKDMLELDDNANEFSRLCCQIELSDDLDGVELTVAAD